jgi:replicative DNA helicase
MINHENEFASAAITERHLLAALLRSEEDDPQNAIDTAMSLIRVEDFTQYPHQCVFKAICELHEARKQPMLDEVYKTLLAHKTDKELGTEAPLWIYETYELEEFSIHTKRYCYLIREFTARRRLRQAAQEIVQLADTCGTAAESLAMCEETLFALCPQDQEIEVNYAKDLSREALSDIDRARSFESDGLSTGFTDVDQVIHGFRAGQLIVIGARPATGKTALGISLALNAAQTGTPSLFVSMEMPRAEIMARIMAMKSEVRLRDIQSGRIEHADAGILCEAAYEFGRQPFGIIDTAILTVPKLAAIVRRETRRKGIEFLVIDYLQLLTPERSQQNNRNQEIGLMCRQLKVLAISSKMPIVLLCQLNRDVENRSGGEPRLSDLRESGEIEQHADIVLLMSAKAQAEHDPIWSVDIRIAKNRNGPIGKCQLAYRRPHTRFENHAK